jgi:hypothetical protein
MGILRAAGLISPPSHTVVVSHPVAPAIRGPIIVETTNERRRFMFPVALTPPLRPCYFTHHGIRTPCNSGGLRLTAYDDYILEILESVGLISRDQASRPAMPR